MTTIRRPSRYDENPARYEADRLTDADRTRIIEAIESAIHANYSTWTWDGLPTLERIAWHAIGCDARDLRGSELLWIEHTCREFITECYA